MGAYTQNHIPNGNLELWDAGPVPREMDAQVTNTTLTTLDRRTMDQQSPEANLWAAIAGKNNRLVYEGFTSLRATLTAAAAIDDFRLFPEGCLAALTGASTEDLRANLGFHHKYGFTFGARCNTNNNLIRIRIVLRDATDTPRMFLNQNLQWEVVTIIGTAVIDIGLGLTWKRYGVGIPEVPYQDSAGNVIENMVWTLSNGSAGAQVIDLDDIVLTDLTQSFTGP
jgi:hypothetical protein